MSTKRLVTLFVALPAILLFAACSGGGGNNNDGGSTTDGGGTNDAGTTDAGTTCVTSSPWNLTGTVAVHPISLAIDSTATLANTTLTMDTALGLLGGSGGTITYSDAACTPVTGDITPDATNAATATFSYQNVNLDTVSLGLIAVVDNSSAGSTFVNTAIGVAPGPPYTQAELTGLKVFAVTKSTEATLAPLDGKSAGQLTSAGFILGQFIDKNTSNPISGATLLDASSNTAVSGVIYPKADFSGVTGTGSTSSIGVFVLVGTSLANYTGQATGYTSFSSQQASTVPNSCFVMFLEGTP